MSSSTTWYALGFIESMRGVRKGEKVLQVGVGSGIKCGVNVWQVSCSSAEPKGVDNVRRLVLPHVRKGNPPIDG